VTLNDLVMRDFFLGYCLLEFGAGPLDGLAGRLAAEMPRSLPADREDRAPLAGRRAA
jgi:hypothetical protein